MLATEPRLEEIVTPFEEGLSLFSNYSLTFPVTKRASNRRLDAIILHGRMRRFNGIRTPNLAVGG
jgi:hypothetical protein